MIRGKNSLYKLGLHVPLIARYPKIIKPGSVSDILISGKDLGPTMLDVAGVQPDPQMTGKSFKHAMQGNEIENHEYLFAARGSHASALPGRTSSAFDLSRTVFNKQYKFIYNPLFPLPYSGPFWNEFVKLHREGKLDEKFSAMTIYTKERPIFEFFDLQNDPNEFVNLSGKKMYKELEHEFKAQLHRWMIIYRDVVPLPIPPGSN